MVGLSDLDVIESVKAVCDLSLSEQLDDAELDAVKDFFNNPLRSIALTSNDADAWMEAPMLRNTNKRLTESLTASKLDVDLVTTIQVIIIQLLFHHMCQRIGPTFILHCRVFLTIMRRIALMKFFPTHRY